MGWNREDLVGLLWGDEPQDIMDNAINMYFGINNYKDIWSYSIQKRVAMRVKILNDKRLKNRLNKTYLGVARRNMTNNEFKNLADVGLMLGGKTIY
jgi:hypothetical protein